MYRNRIYKDKIVADNNEDVSREFNEFVKRLVEGNQDAANDLEKAFKVIGKHAGSFGKELNDLDRAAEGVTEASKKEEKSKATLSNATKELAALTKSLGSTITSSDQGMGKYGGAIEGATDTIASMTSKLGFFGVVVGELIKMFGGLAALGLKQNDELTRSFQSLRDFGIIFDSSTAGLGKGIDDLLELKNSLGGTNENIVYFGSVLKNIAPDLINFGGSVNEGARNFRGVTKRLFEESNLLDLTNLGYTQQDIIKFAGQFINNETKFGKIQAGNLDNTTQRTKEYLETLSELNQLTGVSRDEAQKAVELQQQQFAFQAKLMEIEKTQGSAVADRTRNAMTTLLTMLKDAPDEQVRILKLFGNNMIATEQDTANSAQRLMGTYTAFNDVVQGSGNVVEGIAKVMSNVYGPALNQNIQSNITSAKISEDFRKEMGYSSGLLQINNKLQNMQSSGMQTQINDMIKMAKLEEAARSNDAKIREPALEELKQIKARAALNKAAASTFETVMDVISKFTDLIYNASVGLAKFVKVFTMGAVDFTDSFRDISTVQGANDAIVDEMEKQVELVKERTKLEKRKADEEAELKKIEDARLISGNDAFKFEYEKHLKEIRNINKDLGYNDLMQRENIKNLQAAGSKIIEKNAEKQQDKDKSENQVLIDSKTLASLTPYLKEGALNPNAPIDPKVENAMIGLADDLNKAGYSLKQFTSVNTGDHNEGSKHSGGGAFDFTVTNKEGNPVTHTDAPKIAALMEKYGLKFKDELEKPKGQKVYSGAHFHAEVPTLEPNTPAEPAKPPAAPLVNPSVSVDTTSRNSIMENIKDANKKIQEQSSNQSLKDRNFSWNDLTDGLEVLANKMDTLNESMQRMSVAVA